MDVVDRHGGAVRSQGGDGDVTLKDVVDHVVYIGEKIGWDHVGFGSDFDGMYF